MNIKERIKSLKMNITSLFVLIKYPETPWYSKALGGMAVFYALSPIDLIPDFIPILGYLDDFIILPFLIFLAVKLTPSEIMERARKDAEGIWKNGKPKRWYYGIPIVFIWIFIVLKILKII